MYLFLIKDDELLEKYDEIWEKVKNSVKKEFDSKSVYIENITIIKYQEKALNLFVYQLF